MYCIHTGLQAGKWPDLMTSKPDALSTLECHCTYCTGTILADTIAQWSSSGNPVLICIIGTHWKTTGATSTLGCHWNHTGWCQHPVVSQLQSSVNLHNWNTLYHHWKTTGSTLQTHRLPTIPSPVASQCTLGSNFQAHWIATWLPLNYHWLRVRVAYKKARKLKIFLPWIKHSNDILFNLKLLLATRSSWLYRYHRYGCYTPHELHTEWAFCFILSCFGNDQVYPYNSDIMP